MKNSQHPEGKRLISFNVCIVFIWEYLACKYSYRLSINISASTRKNELILPTFNRYIFNPTSLFLSNFYLNRLIEECILHSSINVKIYSSVQHLLLYVSMLKLITQPCLQSKFFVNTIFRILYSIHCNA